MQAKIFRFMLHSLVTTMNGVFVLIHHKMKIEKTNISLIPQNYTNWQNRSEWFFNREHTDTYEQWYEGRYKRAEVWQKKVMEQLVSKDNRVKNLLEFGCGTGRFTRWWKNIEIEATGADISPLMLSQAIQLFDGDLVMSDSHYMPFKDHSFDALAFITTFEYYNDPVKVIREAARVGKYGIAMGMMNRNSTKVVRRRMQQMFGKNPYYITATFYTPKMLSDIIHEALRGREYTIQWTCTGLPKWFPIQQWNVPIGDFFGLYIQLNDVD
jgi:ubiquinone/menaquinone biosynthesis C-methylase UbiE